MLLWVFVVSLFETMFYYESLADLRFTDICLPLSPKCWDSKRVPPCLATLGFLSPSPVLHAHHRSQTPIQMAFLGHLFPGVPLLFAVCGGRRGQLHCMCFYIDGGASLLSMCSPGTAFVEPPWSFWEQQSEV